MQLEVRQRKIEDYLNRVEFASLEELAQHVEASVSTVRRDVTSLEEKGFVRRTHGGARIVNPRSDEFAFAARDSHESEEKERIGGACAGLIAANETVIIDAGTTCFHAARHLEGKSLHILTNSLPVANHFASSQTVEVIVSGGVIYPRLGVLVGPLAVEAFAKTQADVAIMSCGGITPDGVTNSHGLLIDIQRAVMRAAMRVILCVDHTKFGRQSISRLCGLEDIDVLISDESPPSEMLAALETAGVEVMVAAAEGTSVLRPGRPRTTHAKVAAPETAIAPSGDDEKEAFLD